MIKFKYAEIVFAEIPTRVSFAFSISNCQNRCKGCHSPELRCDIGEELTEGVIDRYSSKIKDCNCVLFMGEGNDVESLIRMAKYVKERFGVETALYSGRDAVEDEMYEVFDFVKTGHYDAKYGALNERTTNQRLYYHGDDITHRFWKENE